jgi:hypothetical protein
MSGMQPPSPLPPSNQMTCPKCGHVSQQNESRFCPQCGASVKSWRQSPVAITLWLIFFFPYGMWLLWKHPTWSQKRKTVVTVVTGILVLIAGMSNSTQNEIAQNANQSFPVARVQPQPESAQPVLSQNEQIEQIDKVILQKFYLMMPPDDIKVALKSQFGLDPDEEKEESYNGKDVLLITYSVGDKIVAKFISLRNIHTGEWGQAIVDDGQGYIPPVHVGETWIKM